MDRKIRFLPEGFEMNIGGIGWPAVYRAITEALQRLQKSSALLVP
jgi:hypothetical protein